jgi:metal-sulfur cluster biosynthetic enzyme
MPTTEEVYDQLKQVFDPEIPVNIVDLGLIYDVKVEDPKVLITMTLTSQSCPEARTIPDVMRRRCNSLDGVEETDIEIVFEPAWTPHLISDEGRKALGMDDAEESDD